jgi:hypothetical protein
MDEPAPHRRGRDLGIRALVACIAAMTLSHAALYAQAPPVEPTPADPPWTFRLGESLWHPQIQIRFRGEERVHPYASSVAPQDEAHLVGARFRLGLGMTYRALRVLVEVQDARDFGTAPPGSDLSSGFGVHQAYVEVRRSESYVKLGRQEVAYGDERLIGPLDWTSSARAFDAFRAHYGRPNFSLDVLGAVVAPELAYRYTGPPPFASVSNGDFLGAVQLGLRPVDAFGMELLYLVRRDGANATDPARDRRINASSLRLAGTLPHGLRYVVEGIFEWGEIAGARMLAYGGAADLFYAPTGTTGARVAIGGSLGSGERSGRIAEFENFFPTNHKFYGYADLFGLRNLRESHLNGTYQWSETPLSLLLAVHTFSLDRPDARWTNAVGAVVAPATPGSSRFLGAEVDAVATYRFAELFGFSGGYTIFIPARAAERLGRTDAHPWLWAMLDFRTP